ncbi:putative molybdenum ABC transporter ATP-binding protein [Selenomonas ruminantium subsp. lactilytica TAM6421]|uniref:Putative molybdenum ABC transporter ATP-binding protein n=1 Tax=Selenomonas ruminantium subsp. lactilytica (strain NBRC 103574 / TAM6421) TaxID=927704 RepID=I0GNZ6_SELRL|nr:ATP-binding cassette domain-containing protein [Selenomonas ruminantium]BAL82483.1 putative molybdenum ABC transporter ATP-binding protein [Selenomonas ruminantium subsp. lactilytica TAM6421]
MELSVDIEKKLRSFTLQADFTVQDEIFALLGASGCGKSMTLKCIAGLETPDRGRIVLNGRVLFDSEAGINLKPQARKVGYLFQNYALFPNMTIAENIAFVACGNEREKSCKVQENLARFKLENLAQAYPHELSGGQQQRAALARILAADAELLLLDEPFSALDSYLKWQLEIELGDVLQDYDGAALLVSHDRGEVYRLADRIAVINQGQMEAVHTKHGLFKNPDTLAATLLTGCKNISAAKKIAPDKIAALDWQLELHVAGEVPDHVQFAGIRAHYMEVVTGPGENIFAMEVVKVVEDVFSYLIMLRRQGTSGRPLRLELSKESWKKLQNPASLYLRLPPAEIMLMER